MQAVGGNQGAGNGKRGIPRWPNCCGKCGNIRYQQTLLRLTVFTVSPPEMPSSAHQSDNWLAAHTQHISISVLRNNPEKVESRSQPAKSHNSAFGWIFPLFFRLPSWFNWRVLGRMCQVRWRRRRRAKK